MFYANYENVSAETGCRRHKKIQTTSVKKRAQFYFITQMARRNMKNNEKYG